MSMNMRGVPKDTGWSWVVMIGAAMCMFFVVGTFKSLGILFVEFLEEFQASSAMTAWMMGGTAFCMSVLAPAANHVAARASSRLTVALGTISCACAFLATSYANNIITVVCCFGIFSGVGYAGLYGPSLMLLGVYFTRRRSLAHGLAMAGASVGQLVIPLLMRWLIHAYTLRGALLVYAAVHLHGLVAAMLLRPPSFYTRSKQHDKQKISEDEKCKNSNTVEAKLDQDWSTGDHVIKTGPDDEPIMSSNSHVANGSVQKTAPLLNQEFKKNLITSSPLCDSDKIKSIEEPNTSKESQYHIEGQSLPEGCKIEEQSITTEDHPLGPVENDEELSIEHEKDTEERSGRFSNVCRFFCGFYQWHHMTNALFLVYVTSMAIGCTNYIDHFIFIPPRALELGYDKESSTYLLTVIAVTDLIGRVCGGYVADLPCIRRSYLMGGCLVLIGLVSVVTTLVPGRWPLVALCVVLGLAGGTYVSLMAVVLIDFLGLPAFPSAFGLAVMFQGLLNTVWPSFLGLLRDVTGTLALSLCVAACCLVASGAVLFLETCARRLQDAKLYRDEARLKQELYREAVAQSQQHV